MSVLGSMKSLRLLVPHPITRGSTPIGNQWAAPLRSPKPQQQLSFPTPNSRLNATSTPSPPIIHAVDCPSTGPLAWEDRVEKVIYGCRFMTILGVGGSLMGSIICFLKGCVYVMNSFTEYSMNGGRLILMLVEAIDIYLIGTVMLVFGMGLYELFISVLDIDKTQSNGSNLLGLFKLQGRPEWLEIQSLNELKTKLGHVIVMVLLIGLFEKSKKVVISSPTDLLCFTASIFLSSGSLYLLAKLHTPKRK